MTEKVQSQNIDFTGELKHNKQAKFQEIKVMDYNSQLVIVEINKNYNKMINNMFSLCGKKCIGNFSNSNLGPQEKICLENCQKKFYNSYVIGKTFVDQVINESKSLDLFSDKTEVDLIQQVSAKKI